MKHELLCHITNEAAFLVRACISTRMASLHSTCGSPPMASAGRHEVWKIISPQEKMEPRYYGVHYSGRTNTCRALGSLVANDLERWLK